MQEQPHGHAVRDAAGRVLTDIKHGGHVLTEDSEEAAALAGHQESVIAASAREREQLDDEATTPFDYLFERLAEHFPDNHLPNAQPAATVAALKALGAAMV